MPAVMQIDQAGLPAGTPGVSRTDGLATGALVTLTSTGGGTTHSFRLLGVALNDVTAVPSLVQTGPTTWTFSPQALRYGSYRIELIVDEGLATEAREIRIFGIRTPNLTMLIPAWNEAADPAGNLSNMGAAVVAASEMNEPVPVDFPAGNPSGWWAALAEALQILDLLAPGGAVDLQDAYIAGNTIVVTAAEGTVQISNAADATDLLTLLRTFAGGGNALTIDLGALATGYGLDIRTQNAGARSIAVRDAGGTERVLLDDAALELRGAFDIFGNQVVAGAGPALNISAASGNGANPGGDLSLAAGQGGAIGQSGGDVTVSVGADPVGGNPGFMTLQSPGGSATGDVTAVAQPTHTHWGAVLASKRSLAAGDSAAAVEHVVYIWETPDGSRPAAVANRGYIYTRDVGGRSELYYRDDSGADLQLSTLGLLNIDWGEVGDIAAVGRAAAAGALNEAARADHVHDGGVLTTTTPGAYPYTILSTDEVILVDTSAARTLNLPAVQKRRWLIIDSVGSAGTNPITLNRVGGEKINGVAANRLLQTDWGVWDVIGDGTDWWTR